MAKIRVVTDSTSDLPDDLLKKYNITMIPLDVIIDGVAYKDRVDITNEEFYRKLKDCSVLPTTSQIPLGTFKETYEKLAQEGAEHIISIHLAKELSGTVEGARMAGKMVKDKVTVHVIDSQSATMGLGLIVLATAQAQATGMSIENLEKFSNELVKKSDLFFLLDSLENLQKGGRIGKAGYLVGSLLNIKPILRLKDGYIHAYEKVRGNKVDKAMNRLIEVIAEHIDPNKKVYCAVGYCDNREVAEQMVEKIKDKIDCDEYVYMQIGNVVSTHIGMGAVGIAFYQ